MGFNEPPDCKIIIAQRSILTRLSITNLSLTPIKLRCLLMPLNDSESPSPQAEDLSGLSDARDIQSRRGETGATARNYFVSSQVAPIHLEVPVTFTFTGWPLLVPAI